jgi:hypothetical protein
MGADQQQPQIYGAIGAEGCTIGRITEPSAETSVRRPDRLEVEMID